MAQTDEPPFGAADPWSALAVQIDHFMDHMNQWWAVPFEELRLDSFLKAVQNATQAEAVSVFLRDPDRPTRLLCAAGAGYKDFYRQWVYWLDRPSLTQRVYTGRIPVSYSADELDPSNKDSTQQLPGSTLRCQSFLLAPFRNCVLVPLLFRHSEGVPETPDANSTPDTDCLGVLKLENQRNRARTERFDNSAFLSARVLGRFLAQILQQWQYRQLFASAARKPSESRKEYVGRLPELVSKFLRAEAAAFYSAAQVSGPNHVLTFESATGYKPSHSRQRFETGQDRCVISDVARSEVMCARINRDYLAMYADDKFVKTCRDSVCDSEIRSLLLIPVASETKLLGILSAINKIDGDDAGFGELDEQICRVFAGRIAPDIEALASRPQPPSGASAGFALLEKHLGPTMRLKGMALRRKAAEVDQIRLKFRGQITGQTCAEYLRVSRAYYLKLIKPLTQQSATAASAPKTVYS